MRVAIFNEPGTLNRSSGKLHRGGSELDAGGGVLNGDYRGADFHPRPIKPHPLLLWGSLGDGLPIAFLAGHSLVEVDRKRPSTTLSRREQSETTACGELPQHLEDAPYFRPTQFLRLHCQYNGTSL